jgi:hypothetical protein
MNSKSTIRKMRGTPLTAAQTRRLDKIIKEAGELEFQYITLRQWADAQGQGHSLTIRGSKENIARISRAILADIQIEEVGAPQPDRASVEAWRQIDGL